MRTWSKRVLSLLLSAVLLIGLLSTGAMAAAAPQPIGVDINGKAVNFTVSAPQQAGGCTYVPVRPVFEGLGASVRYVAAEERIVIERGGVTLSMVMGKNELTYTENGLSVTVPMKSAAYIRGGLVYVPVRDPVEALGCIVGWDNKARTVIIVDPQPIAEEAMANYRYSLLESYSAYSARFGAGTWETDMTMAMTVTMMAAELMKLDATVAGVTANASEGEMSMTMKLDMSGLADLVELLNKFSGEGSAAAGLSPEEAVMELAVEARVDLAGGKIYMLMDGLPEEAGLPAGTWLCMDMNEMIAMSGQSVDFGQLMEASSSGLDIAGLVVSQARLANVNSRANAVANVRKLADAAAKMLSDSSFTKEGPVYTMSMSQEGAELTIRLTVDGNGNVTGYEVDMDMSEALGQIAASLGDSAKEMAEYGMALDDATFTVKASMNEENVMTAVVEISVGDLFGVKMNMDGKYTASDKTPATQPPAGATVVDYVEWLNQQAG